MDQYHWSHCGFQSIMYSVYYYRKYRRVFLKQSKCLHMFLNEMPTAGHAVKVFIHSFISHSIDLIQM